MKKIQIFKVILIVSLLIMACGDAPHSNPLDSENENRGVIFGTLSIIDSLRPPISSNSVQSWETGTAIISTSPETYNVETDSQGHFLLNNIPPGEYDVFATILFDSLFETASDTINCFVYADDTTEVDFLLEKEFRLATIHGVLLSLIRGVVESSRIHLGNLDRYFETNTDIYGHFEFSNIPANSFYWLSMEQTDTDSLFLISEYYQSLRVFPEPESRLYVDTLYFLRLIEYNTFEQYSSSTAHDLDTDWEYDSDSGWKIDSLDTNKFLSFNDLISIDNDIISNRSYRPNIFLSFDLRCGLNPTLSNFTVLLNIGEFHRIEIVFSDGEISILDTSTGRQSSVSDRTEFLNDWSRISIYSIDDYICLQADGLLNDLILVNPNIRPGNIGFTLRNVDYADIDNILIGD